MFETIAHIYWYVPKCQFHTLFATTAAATDRGDRDINFGFKMGRQRFRSEAYPPPRCLASVRDKKDGGGFEICIVRARPCTTF